MPRRLDVGERLRRDHVQDRRLLKPSTASKQPVIDVSKDMK
jgi:hypothetical protein